jgi:hypothetical protein
MDVLEYKSIYIAWWPLVDLFDRWRLLWLEHVVVHLYHGEQAIQTQSRTSLFTLWFICNTIQRILGLEDDFDTILLNCINAD